MRTACCHAPAIRFNGGRQGKRMAGRDADRRRIRLHHRRGGLGRLCARQSALAPIRTTACCSSKPAAKDNWIWFHIPVGYLFAIGNPRSDWMFKTEPEPGLNGRALNYPRGKVIGGCSAINAMIYMRGQAADYDHWRQLGLTGWGWDDVLPLFRKQTDHFLGDERASRRPAASGASRRRACSGNCSTRSARPRRNTASRRSTISIAATTRARLFPCQPANAAGAGRRRAAF